MERPLKKAKRAVSSLNLKRRRSKRKDTLMGGHTSSAIGLFASTFVHILVKLICHNELSYKFAHALSRLQSGPRKELLVLVEMHCGLYELICGHFNYWPEGNDPRDMVAAFPMRIVGQVETAMNGNKGKDSLRKLQRQKAQMPDPTRCFIFSGNLIRYFFEVVKFTPKPMSTLLNPAKYNKMQLGGAIALVIPVFERMSLLAWEAHGGTDRRALRKTNKEVSYTSLKDQNGARRQSHQGHRHVAPSAPSGYLAKEANSAQAILDSELNLEPMAFKGVANALAKSQVGSEERPSADKQEYKTIIDSGRERDSDFQECLKVLALE